MTRVPFVLVVLLAALVTARLVRADQPPPRVGPYVVDVRGALPQFPQTQGLADSRGLPLTSLPGSGIGLELGAHVYPLRWRAVTFGVGGEVMLGRWQSVPPSLPGQTVAPAVTARLTLVSPQVSLNFGGLNGWSYLSAGLGWSTWSIIAEGADPLPQDQEQLKTINYGGGARWLAKRRVGVSVDVRFYAVNPGLASGPLRGSPRATLLVIAAGIALR
jgi:hypothetical protein